MPHNPSPTELARPMDSQPPLLQLVDTIARLNSLRALDAIYSLVSDEFLRHFDVDVVNILLADDSALPMVHTGFSERFRHLENEWQPFRQSTCYSLTARDGQSALSCLNSQRFLVQDAQKILHLPMSDKDRQALQLLKTPRTIVMVPIRLQQQTIGVLWLATLEQAWTPGDSELTLIELLASIAGSAIVNAKTHGLVETQKRSIEALNRQLNAKTTQLDQLARKDRLTGLNNARSFEEELRRRVDEAERTGTPVSLILFDVDRFKTLNDSVGRPAGNEVLKHIAARVSINVRDMDFVARYGGEEFAVLLPACDVSSATVVAERVRQDIEQAVIATREHLHRITISAGCAEYASRETASQFVSRAGVSLSEAKQQGRNRVVVARAMERAAAESPGIGADVAET